VTSVKPPVAPGIDSKSLLRAVARFTVAQGVVVALVAWGLTQFVWSEAASAHAVRVSAWVAFFVQILTFTICKLVATQNLIAGWGLGTLLRFATVGVWAFMGIKALGLAPTPALYSLATFFFVSTLIEPLFLNN
jgi:hypothetical protein